MTIADQQFAQIWQTSSMLRTWKVLRKSLKTSQARDAIDHLEFELDIKGRLKKLREEIISGTYVPVAARSFQLAKSKGAYRVLSVIAPRDLLVFRHLSDEIYRRARRSEPTGAYFGQKHPSVSPVGEEAAEPAEDFYHSAFPVWLRYHQYKTQTLLKPIRPIMVTTDVTNYFESVQHDLLLEYLSPLALPRKAIGLLARILEVYKPSSGHSPTPKMGLPVDEHDCSRQLAHVFLFEHDQRIIKKVGAGNYVRWMDDQNMCVASETEARKVVRLLTTSLSQQRLVLNSSKTNFLNPGGVASMFHLQMNDDIDEIESGLDHQALTLATARLHFNACYADALLSEGKGNWDKVLKRLYSVAARIRSNSLRNRALADLVKYPLLAERIFQYFVSLQDWERLYDLFEQYVASGESLYEDVETSFFETLLRSNVPDNQRQAFRGLARRWCTGETHGSGRPHSRGAAALVLYWLGDGRAVRTLEFLLSSAGREFPPQVSRALLCAYIALSPENRDAILDHCAEIGTPSTASLATLVRRLSSEENLQLQLPNITPRKPKAIGLEVFEARTWLRLEILALAVSPSILQWLELQRIRLLERNLGPCEDRAFSRWTAHM